MTHPTIAGSARACGRAVPPGARFAGAGPSLRLLVLLAACLALGACESVRFYGQAVHGELTLLAAREPIERVIARTGTPDTLRARLQLVQSARRFAAASLGLPVGDRYSSYVDLGRPYAVWNVFATPPLSLTPRQWCYPIAGCAVYRGYFDRAQAEAYAAGLRNSGDDVYVGGVVAFSTLGWFDDPVLSSFDTLREEDLVGLIFHETAHSLVFAPGDSRFNEGYATFVEEQGLHAWYTAAADEAAWARVQRERAVRQAFLRFVLSWRDQLAALYAQALPEAEMRARKSALFERMVADYRASTGLIAGRYDRFFAEPLNNARLATFSTYYDWVPAFAVLYRRAGSWPAFHAAVRELAALPMDVRAARLDALAAEAAAVTSPGA